MAKKKSSAVSNTKVPLDTSLENSLYNEQVDTSMLHDSGTGLVAVAVDTMQDVLADSNIFVDELSCGVPYQCNKGSVSYDEAVINDDKTNGNSESPLQNFFPAGRRIVHIEHLFKQLFSLGQHQPFNCTLSDMYFSKKEKNIGLANIFTLKCKMCGLEEDISTDTDQDTMDINCAAVLGAISTGNGHSQLVEGLSIMNIPSLCYSRYTACHEKLNPIIHKTAWLVMEEAGKEEYKLAKDTGSVDSDGNPLITVIADGAWCKRSYRTNYNASSGVACIIGQQTGKLLFLGIRNKYCTTCARSESKGTNADPHTCFKNWSGTSTSMEADIIVEGFKSSLALHGLIFAKLVGDGDSSVTKKLLQTRPYGNRLVEKVECRNHLLRNYCGKLRDLAHKRFSGTNKLVPPATRKLLEGNIFRLRTAVTKAVNFRKSEDSSMEEKIRNLTKDLLNGPSHVFGEHSKCVEIGYFCKQSRKQKDINKVPELQACGLYEDIMCAIHRLVHNASSLIMDMDNNSAESYNSVVCKFIGGKRINFAQKGSFQTRCEAAAVCFNSKGLHHSLIHKALTTKSPGKYTKRFLEKCSRKRTYAARRRLFVEKVKRRKINLQADKDYGPNAAEQPDLPEEIMEVRTAEFLKSLEKDENGRLEIERKTRGQSGNPVWIQERSYRITASLFGKICKLRQTTPVGNTIKCILYANFHGNSATRYGQENEPRAKRTFQEKFKLLVEECGLFIDEAHPYLGASPDGLIGDDAIVEIKCPASASNMTIADAVTDKKINYLYINEEGNFELKRNHNYMYQIQGQLNITKRNYCYFVIWTTKDMQIQKIERNENFWEEKMLPHLKSFYLKCLLPEIIDPRVPRMMKIRETR